MTSDATRPGTLGTIRNAGLLLDLLSTGPLHQQLNDLAARSGLTLPTVHRLLRSLTRLGLVRQDPSTYAYGLGPELVRMSESYLMRLPVVQALAPYLFELRNSTKATVQVALLAGAQVAYVDRVDGEHVEGLYRFPHRLYSPLETASGRVLLAGAGPDVWKQATDSKITEATTPESGLLETASVDDFGLQQRDDWAQQPYLLVDSPYWADFVEVAVPVTNQRNHTLAALSATDRRDCVSPDTVEQHIVPQLLRVATTARQILSYP